MEREEFNDRVGKILGIKSGKVEFAVIGFNRNNYLNQRVSLGIRPTETQAKKLEALALEFGNFDVGSSPIVKVVEE